ncbi:MAG: hypothetical protein CL833_00380 [Crocinitomicaceae bacterium]|nr:hypothetical protein [Crocinitomicaceae bacterium]|tara:strand:- start:1416 stop:1892 length:477 start_codon:yes stop_codon:yes gene_type:complete
MGTSYDERIIRSQEGFEASMKHFQKFSSVLRGCTDIDLFYERNGNFMFLEGKSVKDNWKTLTMSWAQWFALKQLRDALRRGNAKATVHMVAYSPDGNYTFFPIGLGVHDRETKTITFTKGHPDSHDFPDEESMLEYVAQLASKMEKRKMQPRNNKRRY